MVCAVVSPPANPVLNWAGSTKPLAWLWHEAQDLVLLKLKRTSLNNTRPSVAPLSVLTLVAVWLLVANTLAS